MEKIKKLRKLFDKFNLDGYLIPKNDEFFGEYVSKNNDNLNYISKFSGSYGFALILKNKNYLFVDGRYTLQAQLECKKLFNICTLPKKFPSDVIKKNLRIGFDPKLHTYRNIKNIFFKSKSNLISIEKNLIDVIKNKIKKEKPKSFYTLPDKETGQNFSNKINKVFKILKKTKINILFVTASENIAWLLNLRGYDSKYSPLPHGYLIINDNKKVFFFCNVKKFSKKLKTYYKNINIIDIKYIKKFIKKINKSKVQIDILSCSCFFENILKKKNKIVCLEDPIYLFKAIKNKVEIKNSIKTHIYDGAAVTKFLFWIRKNYKNKVCEITAQEKLLKFRKKYRNFNNLSFPTISGSGPNGSIIHYHANVKNNRVLKKGDIYLIDSGGQYNYGTTDVTRTISLDNKNKRIKNIFTRVLKGHIAVATYKIKKKTCGADIDLVARKSLRKINLDYNHGTGHGVGFCLNVHEGPHGISKNNRVTFKEGVIVSNEPGYYENGKFGIRIENLITVKKTQNSLKFIDLTLVPIDKTLIQSDLLNESEKNWLNSYHNNVFNKLKKYMNKMELIQLKNYCSNI